MTGIKAVWRLHVNLVQVSGKHWWFALVFTVISKVHTQKWLLLGPSRTLFYGVEQFLWLADILRRETTMGTVSQVLASECHTSILCNGFMEIFIIFPSLFGCGSSALLLNGHYSFFRWSMSSFYFDSYAPPSIYLPCFAPPPFPCHYSASSFLSLLHVFASLIQLSELASIVHSLYAPSHGFWIGDRDRDRERDRDRDRERYCISSTTLPISSRIFLYIPRNFYPSLLRWLNDEFIGQ